jgi:hypothetical protein
MALTLGCTPHSPPVGSNTPNVQAETGTNPGKKPDANILSHELTVEGVGLGSSKEELERIFGKPDKVVNAPQQNVEFYSYTSRGVEVGIASDNKVHTLAVSGPSTAKTQKGIGIGSSMDEVKKAYGEADAKGTYRLASVQGDSIRLQVRSKDNKVTRLYFAWGFE